MNEHGWTFWPLLAENGMLIDIVFSYVVQCGEGRPLIKQLREACKSSRI